LLSFFDLSVFSHGGHFEGGLSLLLLLCFKFDESFALNFLLDRGSFHLLDCDALLCSFDCHLLFLLLDNSFLHLFLDNLLLNLLLNNSLNNLLLNNIFNHLLLNYFFNYLFFDYCFDDFFLNYFFFNDCLDDFFFNDCLNDFLLDDSLNDFFFNDGFWLCPVRGVLSLVALAAETAQVFTGLLFAVHHGHVEHRRAILRHPVDGGARLHQEFAALNVAVEGRIHQRSTLTVNLVVRIGSLVKQSFQ